MFKRILAAVLISVSLVTIAQAYMTDSEGRQVISLGGKKGTWTSARTNIVSNDNATTYGTDDTGVIDVTGYNYVRFKIFMNATTNSMSFACGTATPTLSPYYDYTPVVSVSGYSTTAPFSCACDAKGHTKLFPRVTGLSSGGNVTDITYQLYN